MMIAYEDFAGLRLSAFVSADKISHLDDWEFQDRIWVGEALEFSEWLRLKDDPEALRSLAIDFAVFPSAAATAVLRRINLPLRPGMPLSELDSLLGPRVEVHEFVQDRITCEYFTHEPNRYRISCTVLNRFGLCYLVVMVPPIGGPA